jgi:hypothetical protein
MDLADRVGFGQLAAASHHAAAAHQPTVARDEGVTVTSSQLALSARITARNEDAAR